MSKVIFLSTPYSAPTRNQKELNYHIACIFMANLLTEGFFVLSPVVQGVPLSEKYKFPDTWDFWKDYCEKLISLSDEVFVPDMHGWETSKGVTAEIEIAKRFNKEVRLITIDKSNQKISYIKNL